MERPRPKPEIRPIQMMPKQEMYIIRRQQLRPTFDGRRHNGKGTQTRRGI
jgi:hypothetical protein